MKMRLIATVLAGVFLMGAAAPDDDPYTWMEEIEGARALDWAFRGGLAVILALLVFTTVNDLASLGLWDRLERLIG